MTEEQRDQAEGEEPQAEVALEEEVAQEEGAPAEEQKKGWPVVITVLAVILALCAIVTCIAAAIAVFSGDGDETPEPTAAHSPPLRLGRP